MRKLLYQHAENTPVSKESLGILTIAPQSSPAHAMSMQDGIPPGPGEKLLLNETGLCRTSPLEITNFGLRVIAALEVCRETFEISCPSQKSRSLYDTCSGIVETCLL